MFFYPVNGYIRVEKLPSQEESTSLVYIPEDSLHVASVALVRVVDDNPERRLLAVDATMLEEFAFEGETIYLVKQQYVKGMFTMTRQQQNEGE